MEETLEKSPTNEWVGQLTGHSYSGASLLRRGLRGPTLDTMRRISQKIGWPINEQSEADLNGTWTEEFEVRVRRAFAESNTEGE